MSVPIHRYGAVAYALWGVLHVFFGVMFTYGALSPGSVPMVDDLGLIDSSEAVQGVFAQHGWNLLWAGLFATVVAVWLNWKNDTVGFWMNATIVSLFDIGFIVFVLLPGHMTWAEGAPGPVLWVIALVLTSVGYRRRANSRNVAPTTTATTT